MKVLGKLDQNKWATWRPHWRHESHLYSRRGSCPGDCRGPVSMQPSALFLLPGVKMCLDQGAICGPATTPDSQESRRSVVHFLTQPRKWKCFIKTVIHGICFSLIITSKKQLHPERREGNLKPKARLSLAPSSSLLAA